MAKISDSILALIGEHFKDLSIAIKTPPPREFDIVIVFSKYVIVE